MRNALRIARLAVLAVAFSSLAACQAQAPAPAAPAAPAAPNYAAEYGPMVDAFFAVWNSQEYGMFDSLLADGFIRRAPDQNADGREAQIAFMQQVHVAYPDFHIVSNAVGFNKGVAFTQWTVTGTFTAEGAEPAKVEVSGATMLRIAGGVITEEHAFYDTATILAQTGAGSVPHAADSASKTAEK